MYQYILFALFASTYAHVVNVKTRCPVIEQVQNFDFKTYANGKWFEIARYPHRVENNGDCGWTEYTPQEDYSKIKNFDYSNGRLRSIEGSVKPAPGFNGKMIFSYPYGANKSITQHVFNVLATDNESYLIGYYCKYDEQKGLRQDHAWVLSRSKTLSLDVNAIVDDYLNSSDFLDKSKFIWNDFSTAECKNV